MELFRLILDWRRRLARVCELAADKQSGNSWLWSIRARVLSFLISRYADAPPAPTIAPPPRRIRRGFVPYPSNFCLVDDPEDAPPRPPERMRPLLQEIRQCNRRPRRKPWFVWG